MATVTYARTELLDITLNTVTSGVQQYPDVLGLSNGGFVVAYNSGGDFDLVNFYDAAGTVIGSAQVPVVANQTTPQGQPSLTQLTDGNVVVVWKEHESGQTGVRAAVYTQTGSVVQSNFLVDDYYGDFFGTPSVTTLANGNFVVAVDDSSNIFFTITSPAGVNLFHYTIVNTTTAGTQNDAQITALTGGGFAVTWTDTNPSDQQIRGRIYDAGGNPTSGFDFTIATAGDNTQSSVAGLKNGGLVVAYTDSGWAEGGVLGNGITLQYISATGTVGGVIHVNAPTTIDEVDPDVTVLSNGYVLVSWTHEFDATDHDIYGALFDASGNRIAVNGLSEFFIEGDGQNEIRSALSALANGNFITAFENTSTTDVDGTINQIVRTTTGDATSETLLGDELRDIMHGGGGSDYIDGKGGVDQLYGEAGDDTLVVHSALDQVFETAGEGNDTVLAAVSYALAAGVSVENLATTSIIGGLNINLTGNELAQTITGNTGDNVLNGLGGADTLVGGLGSDTYIVDDVGDVIVEADSQGNDTVLASLSYILTAGASVENLSTDSLAGTAAINLTGNEFGQTITGNAVDNILNGLGGADTLIGSLGGDTYIIDNAGDVVVEADGQGYDTVLASVSYALGAGVSVEALATDSAAGIAAINLTGNEVSQALTGNVGNNVLNGMGGADTMSGGFGNDTYVVDNAGDVVVEVDGQGTDSLISSTSFTLGAGASIESLVTDFAGGTAAIKLTGNQFSQSITGNNGANTLSGLGGSDVLYGLGGKDALSGGAGNDTLIGGAGADKLLGGAGSDTASYVGGLQGVLANLQSSSKNTNGAKGDTYSSIENLVGTSKADVLVGNKIDNKLFGGSGDDTLYGSLGKDFLVGGAGKDTFVFDTKLGPSNVDKIDDFVVKSDTIFLDDDIFGKAGKQGVLSASAFHIGKTAGDADDRIVYDKASGKLWYDADGSGNGAAVHFATLSKGLGVTEADFVLIA